MVSTALISGINLQGPIKTNLCKLVPVEVVSVVEFKDEDVIDLCRSPQFAV